VATDIHLDQTSTKTRIFMYDNNIHGGPCSFFEVFVVAYFHIGLEAPLAHFISVRYGLFQYQVR
jgi:hypothetical protein